ncbi:RagB/SusD family nutrient uptake outer membrane protein [uncultured Winogradskyella sp.]|uniref:RagB/SusD family nutrient uptake outer membrane protein n=1 Tax=uncultured Winogradskyella sp. TaxID=395353 RepID=UPI00260DBA8B|nr:RagB/SusD family nutrient uptake outer membrane protein [uncultured Winogradskyella sp.]
MLRLKSIKTIFMSLALIALMQSCESRLDLVPEDNRLTAEAAFATEEGYEQAFAKLYGGIAVTGQNTTGQPDIVSDDEGASGFIRSIWKVQELPTDEAIIGWNDGGIRALNTQTWTAGNDFTRAAYNRTIYQVTLVNEFLRQTTPEKLDARGETDAFKAVVNGYRTEARFLRALAYYYAMDIFGNVPFVTEADPVGSFLPPQISRSDLFNFLETELLAIENEIPAAGANEYGRADRATVWMLLAKMYLNAEVYTGTSRYTEVITYSNQIIGAGYTIPATAYQHSFLADNDTNGAQDEVIFAVPFDGLNIQSYAGTTFLVHAPVGGTMSAADFGINGGWGGIRTTPTFVEQFPGEENSADQRAMFFTDGQTKEIEDIGSFTNGYAVTKWKNVDVNGNAGSDPSGEFVDTDFPMFRLADVYLMYAEAMLRGGGGDMTTALGYVNQLRNRAYGDASGNISSSDLTLDFILDERSRELYWEGHRRTDLIRYGRFSTQGTWAWKGGVPQGTTTGAFRDLMPIPANDLGVNTNLEQNPGY